VPGLIRQVTQQVMTRFLHERVVGSAAEASPAPQQKSSPQQKASPARLPSGGVSDRVFLLTGDGDLKVARMAKVYLMWSARNKAGKPKGRHCATIDDAVAAAL